MMYVEFLVGEKTYNLRLNTRNIVTLEKQIGKGACSIFGKGDTLPSMFELTAILHASLQAYHHGISLNDAYDIFDNWLEDGHSVEEFYSVIVELYKVSGLFKNDTEENEKN